VKNNLPAIPQGYGLSLSQGGGRSEARYSAGTRNPINLKIDAWNSGYVQMHRAEGANAQIVVWTTDADGAAADQVRGTTLQAKGDSWHLTIPKLPGVGGNGHVQYNSYGGVTVSSVSGNTTIIGNRVFIDGREVTPGAGASPVHVEAWLPDRSAVEINGRPSRVESFAALAELRAKVANCSGEIHGPVAALFFSSSNGGLLANEVGVVDVDTSNGSVEVENVFSGGTIRTSNGGIRVGSTNPDRPEVKARSSNGNVTGTGTVQLDGRTSNGRVRHPR
jgi:hypothetical protein